MADETVVDNRITAQKPNIERVKEVIEWSSLLTAESRQWMEEYVPPLAVRRLFAKLQLAKGALIGLVGLQGVGKSQALIQLYDWLTNLRGEEEKGVAAVVFFKWPGGSDPINGVFKVLMETYEDEYREFMFAEIKQRMPRNPKRKQKFNRFFRRIPNAVIRPFHYDQLRKTVDDISIPYEDLEDAFFFSWEIRELRRKFVLSTLADARAVLIDMRDYGKSDRRVFEADIMGIQMLWNDVSNYAFSYRDKAPPNFVVAIQKELFFGPKGVTHFLLGKMETYELKPLTPQELLSIYLQTFKDPYPFQSDALMRLAKLSRGIPRRFLRYVNLCAEAWFVGWLKSPLIDVAGTEQVVTEEELRRDLDLEFSSLFPKSEEMKMKALRLLSYLSAREGGLNQKRLAEALGYSEMDVSRICDKLEMYGYIRRESTKEGKMVYVNV